MVRLTAILLFVSGACFAQKKDSVIIRLRVSDVKYLLQVAQEYKRALIYDPFVPEDKKTMIFKNIEATLVDIQKRIVIDSVKVKK